MVEHTHNLPLPLPMKSSVPKEWIIDMIMISSMIQLYKNLIIVIPLHDNYGT